MKRYLYFLAVSVLFVSSSFLLTKEDADFKVRIVASGLSDPWSIVCDPSGQLWVTESKGYRIIRIDQANGVRKVMLDLNTERKFPSFAELKAKELPTPQGGLMGLSLHPDFKKGQPYVYVSYVHKHLKGNQFQLRIARYQFNSNTQVLERPLVICDTIPASNDHNGGRMLIAKVAGKSYLFYGVGDQGSGQFSNGGKINKAQDKNSYEGKILRFELSPDKQNNWIPSDNPDGRLAIWSVGHRNPQGLAFTVQNGKEQLFSAEHGPYSDDEINLIYKGGNYGHPLVIGYPDGNYNGLAASVSTEKRYPGLWHTSYPFIRDEKRSADSIGKSYHAPVFSFYPTSSNELKTLFNSIQQDQKVDWKAYAPSGIAIYNSKAIAGWDQSLLITSLKSGKLLRLKLNPDGSVEPKIHEYAVSRARYRDVTVSKDGTKIYIATDSSAITSGPTNENPKAISQQGCILELSYIP
jgi:PQQ-dependent dehydrogenase (s-GDH family)